MCTTAADPPPLSCWNPSRTNSILKSNGQTNDPLSSIIFRTFTTRRNVIPPRHAVRLHSTSGGEGGEAFSTLATSTSKTIQAKAKAGEDGYSLLRRPLSWDSESDPVFEAPTTLDESQDESNGVAGKHIQNQKWFETKLVKRNYNSVERNHENSNNKNVRDDDYDDDKKSLAGSTNALNLFQRTLMTLDYPLVLKTLHQECNTLPAKRIVDASIDFQQDGSNYKSDLSSPSSSITTSSSFIVSMGLTASNVSEIHERYRAVWEMKQILEGNVVIHVQGSNSSSRSSSRKGTTHDGDNTNNKKQQQQQQQKKKNKKRKITPPPLNHPTFDLRPIWETIDSGGVLNGPDVFEIRSIMEACRDVYHWCQDLERATVENDANDIGGETTTSEHVVESMTFEQLPSYGKNIFVDPDLLELLQSAFDQEGKLSGTTFQGIGRLRAKVRSLKTDILLSLDRLLSTPSMKSKISLESGGALYSEVRGRIVIPISEQYANSVGVVHDVSRSGKTVYMEPSEIVKPTNEMNQAIMELQQEENKVWRMLTAKITENKSDIDQSVAVIAQLDLVLARIRLGDQIGGIIPQVKDEGAISLKNAKHPVLLLREIENVVGSDINIGEGKNQGLILTGPNSGGKTVILKLLGLSALMARDGIPIPAHPDGARVDYFNPVLADIGDLQSVGDDLSTFSGHMVCLFVHFTSFRFCHGLWLKINVIFFFGTSSAACL